MARRLRDGGFSEADIKLAGPNERKKNLVARFRGSGKRKPILFIGHLDVVEALRSDWTTDPFEFIEKDGLLLRRGTEDMKEGDAILVNQLHPPEKRRLSSDRDLIVALTADEEGGSSTAWTGCSGNIATGLTRSTASIWTAANLKRQRQTAARRNSSQRKVYVIFNSIPESWRP